MDEAEYKKRFKTRLILRGMNDYEAEANASAAEFDPSDPEPEDHADDLISYMADA